MWFLIFLGAVCIIFFWYSVAKEFQRIAAMKGHDEARYFWWTFLVAALIVMPGRKKEK